MNWDSPATLAKLFALLVVAICADILIVTYPRWLDLLPSLESEEGKNLPSCLKTTDFYAVHLTTHYSATIRSGEADSKENRPEYEPFCDRVPGPGQLFFTVDLMEKDARTLPVGLTFFKTGSGGKRVDVKTVPAAHNPSGVLSMGVAVPERGKYFLEIAFGTAKTADDVITTPILVGE